MKDSEACKTKPGDMRPTRRMVNLYERPRDE